MSILLAVDPGIRACGAALFSYDDGRRYGMIAPLQERAPAFLLKCELVVNPCVRGNGLEAQRSMAVVVQTWLAGVAPDVIVLERQQIYTRDKSKGDPNDLLPLAGVVGGIAALRNTSTVVDPLPREWKGTVEKEKTCAQVLACLTSLERERVDGARGPKVAPSKLHNVIDAIGLGLWHLGRFKRRVIER